MAAVATSMQVWPVIFIASMLCYLSILYFYVLLAAIKGCFMYGEYYKIGKKPLF
jgi:hypothetical protein